MPVSPFLQMTDRTRVSSFPLPLRFSPSMNKIPTPDSATWFEPFHAGWRFAFLSILAVWISFTGTLAAAVAISTQPQGATVILGDRVTFSVVASGTGTLTYQWRKRMTYEMP